MKYIIGELLFCRLRFPKESIRSGIVTKVRVDFSTLNFYDLAVSLDGNATETISLEEWVLDEHWLPAEVYVESLKEME